MLATALTVSRSPTRDLRPATLCRREQRRQQLRAFSGGGPGSDVAASPSSTSDVSDVTKAKDIAAATTPSVSAAAAAAPAAAAAATPPDTTAEPAQGAAFELRHVLMCHCCSDALVGDIMWVARRSSAMRRLTVFCAFLSIMLAGASANLPSMPIRMSTRLSRT